jgi:lipid-A-disaccharide synthase
LNATLAKLDNIQFAISNLQSAIRESLEYSMSQYQEGSAQSTKRVLIVAGEASADRYGARLVERMKLRANGSMLEFYGTGGDRMEAAGVRLVGHARELGHIGPREAFGHLRRYLEVFSEIVRMSGDNPPAMALLLDFPEFNLRLAKKLKQEKIPVIYYISPQIWAWRRGRIKSVQKYVDRMFVILPFEEDFYRRQGVNVEFVGHPILEDFAPELNREAFLRRLDLDPARPTVALLAGSRRKEIDHLLPTFLRAAQWISSKINAQFLVSVAPTIDPDQVRRIASKVLSGGPASLTYRFVKSDSRDILANSDFGLVKSGTCTLEAALVGTPFLIAYKLSAASWHLGKLLIRAPYKGLVNLIAGEEVVPEFLQGDATPAKLAETALHYLGTPQKAAEMRERLAGIRGMLSVRCASETVAERVIGYL